MNINRKKNGMYFRASITQLAIYVEHATIYNSFPLRNEAFFFVYGKKVAF
jgi:hypothetical protein